MQIHLTRQSGATNVGNMARPGIHPLLVFVPVVLLLVKNAAFFIVAVDVVSWWGAILALDAPLESMLVAGSLRAIQAHFLAVVEHRLIPAGARNVTATPPPSWYLVSFGSVVPRRYARRTRRSSGSQSAWCAPLISLNCYSFVQRVFSAGPSHAGCTSTGQRRCRTPLCFFYGCQGAEGEPEKWARSDQHLTSVLAEAEVCCSGQLFVLVGGFNADPLVSSSSAKGISEGAWIDVEKALAIGRGEAPTPTCQFQLDEGGGTRGGFALVCLTHCCSGTSFCHPHGIFLSRHGMPRLKWPMCILPNGLPAGFSMYGSFPPLFV